MATQWYCPPDVGALPLSVRDLQTSNDIPTLTPAQTRLRRQMLYLAKRRYNHRRHQQDHHCSILAVPALLSGGALLLQSNKEETMQGYHCGRGLATNYLH